MHTRTVASGRINYWLSANYPTLILLGVLAGFSISEAYRHILSLLAIAGLVRVLQSPGDVARPGEMRLLLVLFLSLWIPIVVSLIGSDFLSEAYSPAARYLIYPLAGLAVLQWLPRRQLSDQLLFGAMVIVLVWSLDGLVQFIFGYNLAGDPYRDGRITGMFYPSPRIGVVLAILVPVYFEALRRLARAHPLAWALFLPVLAVILLSGSRSSWMLLVVAGAAYAVCLAKSQTRLPWGRWALRGVAVILFAGVLVSQVGWLQDRATAVLQLFSGDYERANQATSLRLPLWQTGVRMFGDHWLNGVGMRAYSLAYDDYSSPPDFWFGQETGHPHLFLLEVATETGLLGVIGYLAFLTILARRTWSLVGTPRAQAVPWGLAALVAAFPLSSALSLYAHFSSALLFFLLLVFLVLQDHRSLTDDARFP